MLESLLLISAIIMLIFESGFWSEMDDMISAKFKFHHLPKIFICQYCQTFWISLIWLLFTQPFSLWLILAALINANVGEMMTPLFKLVKSTYYKIMEKIMSIIY